MSYDQGRLRLNGLIDRVNDRNTCLLMRVLGRSSTVRSSSILIADLPRRAAVRSVSALASM